MARERSTRPYLIRAIYEWCTDSGYTPYISVKINAETRVPMEYAKNGEIVLNIGPDATHKLTIGDDAIQFSARFNGASRECSIPVDAVGGIFARENGQGFFFPPPAAQPTTNTSLGGPNPSPPPQGGKPKLQIVK